MRSASRLAVTVALVAAGLGGCARSVFPPGGPIDTTPPRLAFYSPADSSVRVPLDASVELLFSESMDRQSVRDGIRVYPPVGRQIYDWSGKRVQVSWDRPLAERTTYVLLLSGTARDARGVTFGRAVTIRFSTGDSIDHGQISGVLRAKTLKRAGVPIVAFADSLGARPDTTDAVPSYATETDTVGIYHLTGLPMDRGFTIHAFYDLNNNGSIESETDLLIGHAGAIRLTADRAEVDSVNIVAVDPKAPGVLSGSIATIDSTGHFRVEAFEVTDSTLFRRVERVGPGGFTLRVPEGTYRLKATRLAPSGGGEPGPEIRRDDPIEVKPEGEYGPFPFDFGDIRRPEPGKVPLHGDEE